MEKEMRKVERKICPKCNGKMIFGKMSEQFGVNIAHYRDKRFKGVRFFEGASKPGGLFQESGYLINSCMCEKCGFIEMYADLETDAGDIKDIGELAGNEIQRLADSVAEAFGVKKEK